MTIRLLAASVVALVAIEAAAQTIQLPSFSSVGVNTTVVVPDSGGAYVKRDRRSYQNFNRFGGIPPNRGWGIRRQAAAVGLTARVHDLQALDARGRGPGGVAGSDAPGLRIGAGRAAHDAPLASVAELEQKRAALEAQKAADNDREALALVAKGQAAHAAGKHSLAALYFRMAKRQASPAVRQRIAAQVDALAGEAAASDIRGETLGRGPRPSTTRTARGDP
jgi:hypothetical protein